MTGLRNKVELSFGETKCEATMLKIIKQQWRIADKSRRERGDKSRKCYSESQNDASTYQHINTSEFVFSFPKFLKSTKSETSSTSPESWATPCCPPSKRWGILVWGWLLLDYRYRKLTCWSLVVHCLLLTVFVLLRRCTSFESLPFAKLTSSLNSKKTVSSPRKEVSYPRSDLSWQMFGGKMRWKQQDIVVLKQF
jgi:hypothetical protein